MKCALCHACISHIGWLCQLGLLNCTSRGPACLATSIFMGWFCCLLLPDKLPIYALVMVGLHGQTAQNALPEMFRVILCCRWGNCVKIFNHINHEDKLICITALILTGLIITTKFIALLNANYYWDDPHPFNIAIYHRRPWPNNH